MMTSAEIREAFLTFFSEKGHDIVPSSSIVVKNDPTLMFTNAGMNQFKDYFLGNKKSPSQRVADTQKCLRVSGKHNDLEEVGVDTYHHTMFEMLGNWSFGDYFKQEAIAWSWQLLTEVYRIPKDRLYVTVFQGDENENLPKDEEAMAEWKKWIGEDRIVLGNKKDNFWEMGDTGPCGPCTEIHVDMRRDESRHQQQGSELVNKDDPQVIEIWNNVFIQFNRLKDGSLEPLPDKHVDTGMGLERLVRVLQQKQSNYDTDVFGGIISATERITGKKYTGRIGKKDVAFRVIADHIRAIAFTIADGQLPSNTGAGYVIRRILRRAARYYFSYLDYKLPLLHQLLPLLGEQFKHVFPELFAQIDFISRVIKEEENAFLKTIDAGLYRFGVYATQGLGFTYDGGEEIAQKNSSLQFKYESSRRKKIVSGEFAFELYDTFGFPIDLTQLLASEKGWTVDMEGYEKALQQQKGRSRAAAATDTEDWILLSEDPTNEFVGYDSLEIKTRITRYRKINAKGKSGFQLVLSTTPFYPESGGQVGDTGRLLLDTGEIIISDTKKENDLIIHYADTLPDDLSGEVSACVDAAKRKATEIHHSATHLLHAALRQVVGKHVAQKGSLVNQDHLRFDFSHFSKLAPEEIVRIEALVNQKIRDNIPVVIKQMPKDEALTQGAMALFGEKYGYTVRVVIIDPAYSLELCGGTHVGSTGTLGTFRIRQETAVAAGVRRIEAVSGKAAEDYINEHLRQLQTIKERLKHPKDPLKALELLLTEIAVQQKKIEKQETRQLNTLRNELINKIQPVNGTQFIGEIVEVSTADALKKLCIHLKSELKNAVIILVANIEGKANVVLGIDEDIVSAKNLEAPGIIKEHIAPLIKGGGGGQKTLATAGGQDASQLPAVIETVKSLL
ncbi:MAG: alanine--tRNA ligase [Chitinophagaceae bacterium]